MQAMNSEMRMADFVVENGRFRSLVDQETCFFKRVYTKKLDLKKTVIHYYILHDLFDYHDKYSELVNSLLQHSSDNAICSLMDLPGFGMSTGTRGHVKNLDDYSIDFTHFFNLKFNVSEAVDERKIIVGQGMGGLIILNSILNEKFNNHFLLSGVILSNPFIKINEQRFKTKSLNWLNFAEVTGRLKVKNPFPLYDLISDIKICEDFFADSLIEDQFSINLIEEIHAKGKMVRILSYFLEIPTFFLISENNLVIDTQTAQLFIRGVDEKYRKIKKYQGFKYNLFNDLQRAEVFNDIHEWIKEILK